MKDKIISLLAHGVPPTQVAKAVGCTDSYVSQLMQDEGIQAQVSEKKVQKVERGVKVDGLIEDIEEMALERLKTLMPLLSRPMEIARVFHTVNNANKRTEQMSNAGTPTGVTVAINLSVPAAVAFKLSADQQVVEVDGRSMNTMPARNLNERLKERAAARPLISDETTAEKMLKNIELGIPSESIASVL